MSSYQVLARKWRPQTFADVVGQEHVLTALANCLSLGRIHHAYIFSGTRGVGKTSIARLLVKGLNCETDITATPCGMCNNCREIEQGRFIDLIEIDAASRTKVEDTRDLLDNVQYTPVRGRFKVYLIDEVHMLSRHSFNALLKTLEEPPPHVKFLLATTNPQKLPATILSRCLQFHLKALDIEQISHQLEHILDEEQIAHEPRAIQLLARVADGSLRDALSLTDQAIASGDGKLSAEKISAMLGLLDDYQALSLIEFIVAADGERALTLINEAAARGVEWEALLVGMQSLLHRIAMVQLSPAALGTETAAVAHRMRQLARTVPPTDIQLYYQILLIGRKELPFAPDRRMGVEMTLLRALAFHPRMPLPGPEAPPQPDIPLSETTNQVLAARSKLQHVQDATKIKNSESAALLGRARSINNDVLEHLSSVTEQAQFHLTPSVLHGKMPVKKESYCSQQKVEVAAKPTTLKRIIEHKQAPETLVAKLADEAIKRDEWAAEVHRLKLPKLVEQVALNAWKEQNGNQVRLHLRPEQRHLNSRDAQKTLTKALAALWGEPIELTIIEDNNLSVLTPLEWRQAIYEEKLMQAREAIIADNNVKMLRCFFDAELDEESIHPILS